MKAGEVMHVCEILMYVPVLSSCVSELEFDLGLIPSVEKKNRGEKRRDEKS